MSEQETEEPIYQAEVKLMVFARRTHSHVGFTDGGGRITFPSVERGSYYVEVTKVDYESAREQIDVAPGQTTHAFIHLQPRVLSPTPRAARNVVPASSLAAPAEARKEYEDGVAKLRTHTVASIAHLQKAIELHPGYAEAYAWLGLAYMREKNGDEAMKALTKALELEPKLGFARTLRGKLFLEERQWGRAEEELLQAIQLDPQGWDGHYELARCYFNMGKLDKALQAAQRAHDLPQAATATHLLLYDIHMRRNDRSSALKELEEFAKADPTSPFMPRVREKIEQLRQKR